jgi:hypothetical protein
LSLFRDFGATNGPDSCLWCGRRLPIYICDRTRLHGKRAREGEEPIDPAIPDGYRKVRRRVREGYIYYAYSYVELDVAKIDARRGVHGDGMFCTRGCGEAFGRNAAGHLNLRLAPRGPKA